MTSVGQATEEGDAGCHCMVHKQHASIATSLKKIMVPVDDDGSWGIISPSFERQATPMIHGELCFQIFRGEQRRRKVRKYFPKSSEATIPMKT